ncbi:methylmalonyl Co-A mutase-associated GTPase MeaB [Euzebya tangerina]|uniref:methylmalonyl Co-A mutase-associated GTPase MeaB n=1 Tax=Euzebya tangerina TaxID=591198 RepID=UPI000E3108DA|nr:methylmalonyl Co-A mutase-associated GTPase MeaB [Euzebya tangerina]
MTATPTSEQISELADRLVQRDRRALAQAITLVESTREDHRDQAAELLDLLLPHTGTAVRLGISGPPGAGKSTFIQALGLHLISSEGARVAVLAIDPSSTQSGGSILGDKTRMPQLAAHERAFIRPSPAGESLGGIARRTREVLLLCEAAGFDHVLVETVGVGQSETAVAGIVDTMALLLPPAAGDDLQGIKRGVMELADVVVATKADGALLPAARAAAADARQGLALLRRRHPGWDPAVVLTSAHEGTGIDAVVEAVSAHRDHLRVTRQLASLRRQQNIGWLLAEVNDGLLRAFRADAGARAAMDAAEEAVRAGRTTPTAAARSLLARHPVVGEGRRPR